MRQMQEEAAARRAQEQPASPLKRGWQFIYNNFIPAFAFSNSGNTANDMPPPPTTPTRSRPKNVYNTPGAFPGMCLDSDSESSSPARAQDVEMSDETQSPSPPGLGKATTPDSASFSSTAASSSSGNRSSFYAFPSTSSAATSTEDLFTSRAHACNTADCSGDCYCNDPDSTFRIFNDSRFTGAEEDVSLHEEKEAERLRKRAEDRRRREEEERERARREAEKAEKERIRRREAEQREQFKRQREEHERKEREKREQDEADYRHVENIFAPVAEMEMRQAMERGETEEQLRERQQKIWDEWEALIEKVRRQREEKERLEREREREEKRRKDREEKARKEREEAERRERREHKSKSSSKQSRSHPYARSSNSNRKRGGLHFEPSDDPFEKPFIAGDSPFHRGCRRPNFRKPNFGSRARASASATPTFTSVPKPPTSPTPGASLKSNAKKYSKNPSTYFEWYESEWSAINSLQSTGPLTFKDIPWALTQMPYLPSHVTSAGVKTFLVSRHSSFATTGSKRLTTRERRIAAKKELMYWHPDKFATRVLERVADPKERELIKEAADTVQKALTEFMREPDGGAD